MAIPQKAYGTVEGVLVAVGGAAVGDGIAVGGVVGLAVGDGKLTVLVAVGGTVVAVADEIVVADGSTMVRVGVGVDVLVGVRVAAT